MGDGLQTPLTKKNRIPWLIHEILPDWEGLYYATALFNFLSIPDPVHNLTAAAPAYTGNIRF